MTETIQERIARQRAAREARDGTPEQRAEIKKTVDYSKNIHKMRRTAAKLVHTLGGDVPQSVRDFIEGKN